ncbi:thioredoxin TrxC [Caminibacter mediatlanticus]|uniref:Thioredoxin n=1 Tax=Caminibacter mediatlanticus TB-2 TaxID=391592 RepID=A0AAI9F310_9BACT|nr:thioredoxin TrxC [Caminibacter mediatlanticus]EDM24363.1 Thioredoxin [Caminibacter mediatlanticus TB-2]
MENIIVTCPHCKSLNKLPKKDEYKKAVCGVCKGNLLDNKPIKIDSEAEFNKIISNVNIPVIIDFWAVWCGPCQMFGPTFESVAKNYPLKANFLKVNTEEVPQIAAKFGIRSIPTIVAVKDGVESDRVMGALPEMQFAMWVDKIINS